MSEGTPRTRYCSRCLTTFGTDGERCPNLGCRSARPANGWGELLEGGELIDRTYRVHKRLAIGGAGVTYLAREVSAKDEEEGPLLAVKMLYQQRDQGPYLRRLATEAQILQGLNHPQIVECRGFVHKSGHSPYLVTKFEAGGSLLDHVRRVGALPPRIAAAVAMQVCDALAVAHRQGVIHRDLKPENVLLESESGPEQVPRVRVADFGIAKVFGGVGDRLTRVGAFIGTPQYAAPEQFEGVNPMPATDVYAVGALLYFLVTLRPVAEFMAELDVEDQREHLVRHLPPKLPGMEGEERLYLEECLALSMEPDPGDRCAIDVLAERLHTIALGKDPGRPARAPAQPLEAKEPVKAPGQPLLVGTISADAKGPPAAWLAPAGTTGEGEDGRGVAPSDPSRGGARPPAPDLPLVSADGSAVQSSQTPRSSPIPLGSPSKVGRSASGEGAAEARRSRTGSQGLGPVPTIERLAGDSTAARTSFGCAAVALLGGGAVAVALAALWFLYDDATTLTGREAEPAVVADWQGVAYALGEAGASAEKACSAPPYLAIEVVVEPTGAVREARLLNYPHAPTQACIQKELQKGKLPRAGKGPVRVAVTMNR